MNFVAKGQIGPGRRPERDATVTRRSGNSCLFVALTTPTTRTRQLHGLLRTYSVAPGSKSRQIGFLGPLGRTDRSSPTSQR
jgi:hypothetical protein